MQQITSSNFKFNELPNLPFTAQKEKEQNNQINQSTIKSLPQIFCYWRQFSIYNLQPKVVVDAIKFQNTHLLRAFYFIQIQPK